MSKHATVVRMTKEEKVQALAQHKLESLDRRLVWLCEARDEFVRSLRSPVQTVKPEVLDVTLWGVSTNRTKHLVHSMPWTRPFNKYEAATMAAKLAQINVCILDVQIERTKLVTTLTCSSKEEESHKQPRDVEHMNELHAQLKHAQRIGTPEDVSEITEQIVLASLSGPEKRMQTLALERKTQAQLFHDYVAQSKRYYRQMMDQESES